MADTVEMADIRGLDIDKAVKGFALLNYVFKGDCQVSSTSSDSIRWYQETSTDLTPTAPQVIANISPLSTFPTLEPSWTQNISYVRKYAAESFLSMEDMKSSDIDVFARTLLRLTRAVVKQVDTRIYNVLTESDTPTNIQTFATTAIGGDQWDAASYAGNPIKDIFHAKYLIESYGYDASNAVLYLHPADYRNLMDWIVGKGSQIPSIASAVAQGGTISSIGGVRVKSNINVTQDKGTMFIPQTSVTWKSHTNTTSKTIEEPGLGTKIRVWEIGEGILTDPKSVVQITDLQS